MKAPTDTAIDTLDGIHQAGADWWPLRAFRELEDALFHLRLNLLDIGCVMLRTEGDGHEVAKMDALLDTYAEDWFVNEVKHFIKRTLKRLDCTAKTFFALIDTTSAFTGSLLELALAADRIFMLDEPDETVHIALSELNFGALPMGNNLSRLASRFYGDESAVDAVRELQGQQISTLDALDLGLVTFAPDDIDWDVRPSRGEEKSKHVTGRANGDGS